MVEGQDENVYGHAASALDRPVLHNATRGCLVKVSAQAGSVKVDDDGHA